MRIFSHKHDHEAIAVQKRTVAPFGPLVTVILWRCPCGDVDTTEIAGTWTLAQVRGQRSADIAQVIEAPAEATG